MRTLVPLCFLVFLCYSQVASQIVFSDSRETVRYPSESDLGLRECRYWKLADGSMVYSTCDPYLNFQRCGRSLSIATRCCAGFAKSNIFGGRCSKVVSQWDECRNVVGGLAASGGVNYGDFSKYLSGLPSSYSVTIFAPRLVKGSRFFDIFGRDYGNVEQSPVGVHIVKGKFYARDLKNNQLLPSVYGNNRLKVTKYSFGVICIECQELIDVDVECKMGVVHQIRNYLVPRSGLSRYDRSSVLKQLQSDSRTSAFASALPSDLRRQLDDPRSGKWFTVLAPTNDEWNKITGKYSGKQLQDIARQHVFSNMYCGTSFSRSVYRLKSSIKEWVYLECGTESGSGGNTGQVEVRYASDLCGNRYRFVEQDLTSENGVVHIIAGALVPLKARTFQDLIKDPRCAKSPHLQIGLWMNWIKECNLNIKPNQNYAYLMPIDGAFDWWEGYQKFSVELQKFKTDKEYRCRVARYHIATHNPDKLELKGLDSLWHENKGYEANNFNTRYETNYFQKYQWYSDLLFHYSKVINFESFGLAGGDSMFLLQRINVIPEKTIAEIVEAHDQLTWDWKFLKKTKYNDKIFTKHKPLNLYLATIDKGFKDSRDGNDVPMVKFEEGYIMDFLLLHTVRLYLWGHDIGYFRAGTVHRFKSLLGVELIFWSYAENKMKIGYEGLAVEKWAEVIEFNIHAIDGIIWLLDRFLVCPPRYCKLIVKDTDKLDLYSAACQYSEIGNFKTHHEAAIVMKKTPLKIAGEHQDKCVIYKQPTKVAQRQKKIPTGG